MALGTEASSVVGMVPEIEVIVPVHDAFEPLVACLAALERTLDADQPACLIDDASTDPRVLPLLANFERRRRGVRLIRQRSNRGFVATVNRAMEESKLDVVLLNTDTEVTLGWLDALARCASSDPTIATITPFSNNAEICSFPEFCRNNPPPADPERVAAAIRAAAPEPVYPDLPTGVGFCLYLRRRALAELGLFDEARFGHGYGEENDFCMRAAAAGYRNVLCEDAYVVHLGGRSFGPKGLAPGGDNMERLLERHPDYAERVAAFIRADPLKALRERIVTALDGARQ